MNHLVKLLPPFHTSDLPRQVELALSALGQSLRRLHGQASRLVRRVNARSPNRREKESFARAVSLRISERHEEERRQIARELHDEIGQQLTCLKGFLTRQPGPNGNVQQAVQIVDELIGQVRNLSLSLRPPLLDDLGVLPALDRLFQRYATQNGITVAFASDGIESVRFARAIETAVYRIIQEALTNVARHANVADVAVRLWLTGHGDLRIEIADEGPGFDAHSTVAMNGLLIMRERVQFLRGTFAIESEVGRGTTISVTIPAND